MITSTQNSKIKEVRALLGSPKERSQAGAFVIEGVRLAEEALAAGWTARLVLYGEEVSARARAVVKGYRAAGAPVEQAAAHVLKAASDTETSQGLVIVLEARSLPLPAPLDFVFIPDGVRDPGNLGTMLRTAAAAGAQAALLPPGTADPFAPKVLRAGMGAHFRLPVLSVRWEEIAARLDGLNVWAAAAGGATSYERADFRTPLALIIGGEAEGAGQQALALGRPVSIPMPGGSESLNAAIAAGILLFEVVRQRSAPGSTDS